MLLAGVLLAAPGTPAQAQLRRADVTAHLPGSMGIPQPEPRVTLTLKQRALGRVLSELFKQTSMKYAVTTTVGGQLFDVDVRGVPLSQALAQVLAQDKGPEPLVFYFTPGTLGSGTYTITREFISIGEFEGEPRVSLANARLTQVLPLLFRQMRVPFRVEPDVPPILLTVELRPRTFDQTVLDQVMMEAHKQEPTITYSRDGETYVVHLQKSPVTPGSVAVLGTPPPMRRVTIPPERLPLRDAIRKVLDGSTWKYQVADAVRDVRVTVEGTNTPELQVLHNVLRQAALQGSPTTYREGNGVLYIEPGPLPGQYLLARSNRGPRTTSYAPSNVPLRQAVKVLATATGATVEVAPAVPEVRVSFRVEEATIEEALQALVRAARAQVPTLGLKRLGDDRYQLGLGLTAEP